MSEKNHYAALQEIRKWNIDDVIYALKNNDLSECVDACKKREITGEKLLELSEMKLGLWKRDLSIGNIRKLAEFIQNISKMPAKYIVSSVSSGDDAWDTDFDDDDDEDENEEDNNQKTGNNIPQMKLERKSSLYGISHQENGKLVTHNSVHKNNCTQHNDNGFSPVYKNRTSLQRHKINIPSVFSTVQTTQNNSSTNSSLGNISKPPFTKVNGSSESMRNVKPNDLKNVKPSVPSRPQSLYYKSSSQGCPQTALPKPPEFNNEGSVLRNICDKLLEPEYMDEYESIDDDLLCEQVIKSQMLQLKGLGGSQNLIQQNSIENRQISPVFLNSSRDANQANVSPFSTLHRNNVSQKINSTPHPLTKMELNTAIENLRKSPNLPRALFKKQEETFQTSKNLPEALSKKPEETFQTSKNLPGALSKKQEETFQTSKNLTFVSQEKKENFPSPPIPLPPRNEIRPDTPTTTSTLHLPSSTNALKLNKGPSVIESSEASRTRKEHNEQIGGKEEENDVKENTFHEDDYESISEHVSKNNMKFENHEDYSEYLQPIAPSVPPKPKQASHLKSPERSFNGESNGVAGGSWNFSTLNFKSQQKIEKACQDGKKNNTLPRLMNLHHPEAPRSSATRPLPPPPLPDGNVQRVVKIPLVQMPWYFNVDRARGEEILKNCEDGTFMIRPSTKTQNALTLTLKYGIRPFNICVRLRPDGKYALGSVKPAEQTFSSVEELVNHYTTNELLLYTNGRQAGIVVLTSPPRKDSSQ